uniref:Multiple organellar RNA editing factor 8ic/mitochondrial n=1 Tax=Rhizophora mucronata TaxID=61149 RepID=A0A2P2J6C8_RHIMU
MVEQEKRISDKHNISFCNGKIQKPKIKCS